MESKAIIDTDIDDLVKHLSITRYVDFRHFRNICSQGDHPEESIQQ